MAKEIIDILSLYEGILSNKSIIKEANLFGGNTFSWGGGPSDHGSRALGNWQSDNAWDIMAAEGVPVYSISDGTITKVGGSDKLSSNGVVYGYQVTVDTGDNGIFYTHMGSLGPGIQEGQPIKKGDLIGNIGKPKENPNWPTHVHIGVKNGDIKQFINGQADITGGEGVITPESGGNTSGSTASNKSMFDIDLGPGVTSVPDWAKQAAKSALGPLMKEQKEDDTFYLQYCNVSDPSVSAGDSVSEGTVLGKTSEDVEVSKFDSGKYRRNITHNDFNFGKGVKDNLGVVTIPKDSNEKIKSPVSGRIIESPYNSSCPNQITIKVISEPEKTKDVYNYSQDKEPRYSDPVLGALLTLPSKFFTDKYDKNGKLVQKRWGNPGERVDPWIKDAIVAPFEKIGSLYRKDKKEKTEEEERKKKKINENVEKIKKLLK